MKSREQKPKNKQNYFVLTNYSLQNLSLSHTQTRSRARTRTHTHTHHFVDYFMLHIGKPTVISGLVASKTLCFVLKEIIVNHGGTGSHITVRMGSYLQIGQGVM